MTRSLPDRNPMIWTEGLLGRLRESAWEHEAGIAWTLAIALSCVPLAVAAWWWA